MATDFDPAFNIAKILLGETEALRRYPSGKSKGLADPELMQLIDSYMLGQTQDAFGRQSALAEDTQALADKQRRLRRESDLGLMQEFGGQYQDQMKELYPDQAFGLSEQRKLAERAAEEAGGGLTPSQRNTAEQMGYLYGAQRGRVYDPITMMKQFGEEEDIRRDRNVYATDQLTNLGNMEKGLYGDLPSVIGADSPYSEGVGQISTSFDMGSVFDMGAVDYANQEKRFQMERELAEAERAYATANTTASKKSALDRIVDAGNAIASIDKVMQTGRDAMDTFDNIMKRLRGEN
jgi:hypothetical protein